MSVSVHFDTVFDYSYKQMNEIKSEIIKKINSLTSSLLFIQQISMLELWEESTHPTVIQTRSSLQSHRLAGAYLQQSSDGVKH